MNEQYFTKEQVASGQLKKLLDFLMDTAYDESGYYNDIHVTPTDCGDFIVEWEQRPWDNSFGGQFVFVNDDQVVMTEKHFPDGHYELCHDEEDFQERLKEFLEENKGWVKTEYGTWTNEIENEKLRKSLEGK